MPSYIIKMYPPGDGKTDEAKARYLIWSTIVDAPISYGLGLKEFTTFYHNEYGNAGMFELEARMKRVEANGTSCMLGTTVEELTCGNRAGQNEKELTYEQIWKEFCCEGKG